MKKKNIIILLIAVIVIFLLVTHKFINKDSSGEKEYYFSWNKLDDKYKNTSTNIIDSDKYKDKIINENVLSIDYELFSKEKSITGKIYIDENKHLYITDANRGSIKRISSIKFRTLYVKDVNYNDGLFVYLISEDNKLYCLELLSNNVNDADIKFIETNYKVMKFVNIDFEYDIHLSGNTLFVLADDNNIYDIASGIRYIDGIKILYNLIYVFENNTFTDIHGRIFKDKENKPYKIKYIFSTEEDNDFSGKNSILVITENDRLLSLEKNQEYVYEFNKKVKKLEFDVKYPYISDKLKITFENDSTVELTARCNQYYCINEFAE